MPGFPEGLKRFSLLRPAGKQETEEPPCQKAQTPEETQLSRPGLMQEARAGQLHLRQGRGALRGLRAPSCR